MEKLKAECDLQTKAEGRLIGNMLIRVLLTS
jgi:hypothetical protein